MKQTYESPLVRLTNLELEGFLCASGDPKCYIAPIDADVEGFIDQGVAEFDNDYVLNY